MEKNKEGIYIPEELSKTGKYYADFNPDSNPDEDTYKTIKENMSPDRTFTVSEYLLYPSELRKHFIEINIGITKSNWIFNLFTPEQKSKHLDIAIEAMDYGRRFVSISPKMMEFMSDEQKNKLFQKNIETGKGLSNEVLKLLTTEQLNTYIRKNVELYEGDIRPEIFNLLDLETKLHVITYCGLYNLESEIKDWYINNYQKGLKREEQIKSVIDGV